MPKQIAVEVPDDEGESQTTFLPPAEGGSYIRNPDGSLTRVEGPTAVPASTMQE